MKIPKIDYISGEPLTELFERNCDIVFDRFLYCIRTGFEKNKEDVTIFELGDSGFFLESNIADWVDSLECCITYFSIIENYEKCIECKNLQNEINKKRGI